MVHAIMLIGIAYSPNQLISP